MGGDHQRKEGDRRGPRMELRGSLQRLQVGDGVSPSSEISECRYLPGGVLDAGGAGVDGQKSCCPSACRAVGRHVHQ